MSEKRFEIYSSFDSKSKQNFVDWKTGEKYSSIDAEKLVDLLNELVTKCNHCKEENEQLRKELEQTDLALHRSHLKNKELSDENEQLKEEINNYPINERYAEEIMQQRNDLRKENLQLRKDCNAFVDENNSHLHEIVQLREEVAYWKHQAEKVLNFAMWNDLNE